MGGEAIVTDMTVTFAPFTIMSVIGDATLKVAVISAPFTILGIDGEGTVTKPS